MNSSLVVPVERAAKYKVLVHVVDQVDVARVFVLLRTGGPLRASPVHLGEGGRLVDNVVHAPVQGWGSILDTVSKDTEDTAHSCILSVSKKHFQPTFINGICI